MLYQGTLTTWLGAMVGHYPWFYVYNTLDSLLAKNGVPNPDYAPSTSANVSVTDSSSMSMNMLAVGLDNFVNSELWENKVSC